MKKVISAGSAVALGVIGAAAPLALAPAHAVDATTCAVNSDATTTDAMSNWYQTCVPQHGAGKVEFTISSDVDFPADFKDLSDPSVTVTTSTDVTAINDYFEVSPGEEFVGQFRGLQRIDDGTDPKLQRYGVTDIFSSPSRVAAFKVASISELTSADAPAYCTDIWGDTFDRVWQINFEPLDVMFTQTVAGVEWSCHVVMTPAPEFVAGTILSTDWNGSFPLCMVQGEFANGGEGFGSMSFDYAKVQASNVNPYPFFDGEGAFVADYPRYVAPAPDLPATGVDFAWPLGLAGSMMLAGGLAVAIRRRRA